MELFIKLATEYCNQDACYKDDDPPTYREAIYTEQIGTSTYTEGVPC